MSATEIVVTIFAVLVSVGAMELVVSLGHLANWRDARRASKATGATAGTSDHGAL